VLAQVRQQARVDAVGQREVDVGLVDDDHGLGRRVGQLAQLVDGHERRRRVVGVREDDQLGALVPEVGRQLPARPRLLERHGHELRALDRGELLVEAVGRPGAGDAVPGVEERPVDDREAIVRPVARQHLLRRDAEARRRGLAQTPAHRVGVEAHLLLAHARERGHDGRRGRVGALVRVELHRLGVLLAGSVAAHGADGGAYQREGVRRIGLSTCHAR
jgi:hypothetical protein